MNSEFLQLEIQLAKIIVLERANSRSIKFVEKMSDPALIDQLYARVISCARIQNYFLSIKFKITNTNMSTSHWMRIITIYHRSRKDKMHNVVAPLPMH